MYVVNIFETILKINTVLMLTNRAKMDKAMRIFCSVYLILTLFGVFSILIWGGFFKANWLPNISTLTTLEAAGTMLTTLIMVLYRANIVAKMDNLN